uniref:Uncharacterized protein n=1 Tax=Moniliophthora roreri TaxID=221103 RepID=A0A0W0FXC8_MONRR
MDMAVRTFRLIRGQFDIGGLPWKLEDDHRSPSWMVMERESCTCAAESDTAVAAKKETETESVKSPGEKSAKSLGIEGEGVKSVREEASVKSQCWPGDSGVLLLQLVWLISVVLGSVWGHLCSVDPLSNLLLHLRRQKSVTSPKEQVEKELGKSKEDEPVPPFDEVKEEAPAKAEADDTSVKSPVPSARSLNLLSPEPASTPELSPQSPPSMSMSAIPRRTAPPRKRAKSPLSPLTEEEEKEESPKKEEEGVAALAQEASVVEDTQKANVDAPTQGITESEPLSAASPPPLARELSVSDAEMPSRKKSVSEEAPRKPSISEEKAPVPGPPARKLSIAEKDVPSRKVSVLDVLPAEVFVASLFFPCEARRRPSTSLVNQKLKIWILRYDEDALVSELLKIILLFMKQDLYCRRPCP